MQEFHQWCSQHPEMRDGPWLLLGKGPTFSRRGDFDLQKYRTISLNHVVREIKVTLAHMIDLDVVRACSACLLQNCDYLVMPRHPHVNFHPIEKKLEEFFDEVPVLRELDSQGRLLWYDLELSPSDNDAPAVTALYFSSEAAFGLLAALGVKQVFSLGIDGGAKYSPQFSDLPTCLANGQPSFDIQFAPIEKILQQNAMTHTPLVKSEPMRVFVGSDESQHVAAKVLEFTLRKHASRRVEFVSMRDLPTATPKDPENQPRTGFSFYRFHIPRLCGFEGRGLYLDADMLVFSDVAEVFDLPFNGADVLCTYQGEPPAQWKDNPAFSPGRQLSVMMLNAARLRWDPDEIVRGLDDRLYTYKELMGGLAIVPEERIADSLPPAWNHLEQYIPGETKLLHYTVVPTQPWKSDANPLAHLWMAAFDEAVRGRAVTWEDVRLGIEQGHLKPSLADHFPEGRVIREGGKKTGEELAAAKAKNNELKDKLKIIRGEMDYLRKSAAWKIGRALTLGLSGRKRRDQ